VIASVTDGKGIVIDFMAIPLPSVTLAITFDAYAASGNSIRIEGDC